MPDGIASVGCIACNLGSILHISVFAVSLILTYPELFLAQKPEGWSSSCVWKILPIKYIRVKREWRRKFPQVKCCFPVSCNTSLLDKCLSTLVGFDKVVKTTLNSLSFLNQVILHIERDCFFSLSDRLDWTAVSLVWMSSTCLGVFPLNDCDIVI